MAAEIEEKLNAPGGPSLLAHIAYVYTQEAKSHSGRWLGLEGFVTGIQETGHYISEAASVIGCARLFAPHATQLANAGRLGVPQ